MCTSHLSQHQNQHNLAMSDFAAVKLMLTTSTRVFWYLAGFMMLKVTFSGVQTMRSF